MRGIFGRELLITVLRSVSASQGRVIAATPWGKTKTVTQVGAVLLLILERPYPFVTTAAEVAIGIAVVFTVVSGVDYLWRFRHIFERPATAVAAAGGSPGSESPVDPLARDLGARLLEAGLKLALAESCTGGLVADERFFPHGDEFRGLRVHQTRLQGGDASSDSYCFTG